MNSHHTSRSPQPAPTGSFADDDKEDAAAPRALPDADEPPHESAAESLGRSISQVITGGTHENKVETAPPQAQPKAR